MSHSGKALLGLQLQHRKEKASNRCPCSGAGSLNGVRAGGDQGFPGGSMVKNFQGEIGASQVAPW